MSVFKLMGISCRTVKKYEPLLDIIFSKSDKKNKASYIRGDSEDLVMVTNDVLKEKFIFGCDKIITLYKKLDDIRKKNGNDLMQRYINKK